MPSDAHLFPVSPWEAGHASAAEDILRRMLRQAKIGDRSRVLDLGCGRGELSILLAHEFGTSVVALDDDPPSLEILRQQLEAQNLRARVEAKHVRLDQLPGDVGTFDAVLVCRRLVFEFGVAAANGRAHLGPSGRVIIGYPVWVGRSAQGAMLDFWQKRLGDPLRSPRELLEVLSDIGFEPEGVEAVDDPSLARGYAAEESRGARPAVTSATSRPHASSAVSFALVVGRRKEPDEQPPSRQRG